MLVLYFCSHSWAVRKEQTIVVGAFFQKPQTKTNTMRFTHVLLCVALLVCCLSATTKKSSRFLRYQDHMDSIAKKRDAPEWNPPRKPEFENLIPVNLTTLEQREKYRKMVLEENSREGRAVKRNSPIDLTTYGLRPVDDQGDCGSCFAFAGTHTVEDQYRLAGNSVSSPASIQHVLECCSNCAGNVAHFCNGGYPNRVVNFVATQGDATTSCKAYHSYNGDVYPCHPTCDDNSDITTAHFGSYQGPTSAYLDGIKDALSKLKTVATSFYVPNDFFSYFDRYPSGIYPIGLRDIGQHLSTQGGHAVEIVGWGTENGRDYLKIKNSWGTSWGQGGYFRWDTEDSQAYSLITNVVLGHYGSKKRQEGGELAFFGSDETLGGLMDIDNDDEEVVEAAEFAVAEINEVCDGENYVLEKVLDTQVQSISGSKYHIYLQASTPSKFLEDECTQQYHAHVIVARDGTFSLFNFRNLEPNVGKDLSIVEENLPNNIHRDDDDSGSEAILPSIVMVLFAVFVSLMF